MRDRRRGASSTTLLRTGTRPGTERPAWQQCEAGESGDCPPCASRGDCPLLVARAGDDLEEALDVERRAADERAIDVGLADQLLRVVGFHAAAVDHVALVGRAAAEPLAQPLPDVRVRLLRLDRRRGPAGADRPD